MTATAIEDTALATSADEDQIDDAALGKEEQKHRFAVMWAKGSSDTRIA